MKVVLAEKPSVAREIAAFLGARDRRDGYYEGQGYQVTWALGHLATLKEPRDYDPALKKWSLATLPIVPERFEVKPIDQGGARKQLAIIQRLFRQATELICATDAGREGELIFRYILELTGGQGKPATRLWLSSLTTSAIREAFRRLRLLSDYDSLYDAARCRGEADWIVGLNATRYYTVRYRSSGGLLWSVGRVQTPVLALIVRRDDVIRTFKPEPFWELLTRYREVIFHFDGDRFAREEEAQDVLRRVQGHDFNILGVDRKPERVPPPQLHDLTELQRDMNRRYGLSADATLKAAQSLYEGKLITYPRTDSRYLTNDLKGKVPGILEDLRSQKATEIARLDLKALRFTGRIVNDAKVNDHHAILPTGKSPGKLAPAAQKVYDAVVIRLIAAFYPSCEKEVTTVHGASNGVPFRARGVRVLEPGWTSLYPRKAGDAKDDEQPLPEFRPGERGPHEPFIRRGETTPPKPYTEATLLGAMETAGKLVDDEQLKDALKERGLGTPATRAAIIETLLDRGYIERRNKVLAATDPGRYLIALVQDRELKSPELTGDWEARLRQIERGQLDPNRFRAEIVRYTRALLQADDNNPVDPDRLGECPRCGRPIIAGKKGYGCSGWKEGCEFVLWPDYRGRTLSIDQVRELLQRRVLLQPLTFGDSGAVILQLAENGALMEVPVPTGQGFPTRPRDQRSTGRRGRSKAVARRQPVRKDNVPGQPRRSRTRTDTESALGTCPCCGCEVVEQERSYGCDGWKNGCAFAIWKSIAGKRISAATARTILKRGRSGTLKGFRSKSGKPFDARLVLKDGEVRLDFGN